MNKYDRKQLNDAVDKIREALAEIENVADAEDAKFYELNEGLQATSMGMLLLENAENLQTAYDDINNVLDDVAETAG